MYAVPIELIEEELSAHIRKLTFVPTDGFSKVSAPFRAFIRTKTHLMVPRFYGLSTWGAPLEDHTCLGEQIVDCKFSGTLTDVQDKCVSATISRFQNQLSFPKGGMIVLPCGYGKTVYALKMVEILRLRTLVIVHKAFLVEQWQQRAAEFLSNVTLGTIRQNVTSVDADIVIGMVQSIALRDYDPSLFSQFGLVILDEAHHMCAPVFSRALQKIPSKYLLALSATPDRKDGMNDLLKWSMGDVLFRVRREHEVVKVSTCIYDNVIKRKELLSKDGRPNIALMINTLIRDQRRNELITQHVHRYAQIGRKIIVLSDRIAQLEIIEEKLQELGNRSISLYIGKTTAMERCIAEEKQILLSTYSMSREALDIKTLDTLVMATPIGCVEQVIGRILRKHPDKKTPLVLDVVDPYSIFDTMRWKRRRFYSQQQYENQIELSHEFSDWFE